MLDSRSIQYSFADSKSFPRESGIYLILNLVNGKGYVGQTAEIAGFAGRWNDHASNLRLSKHKNPPLQRSFNKPEHGEPAFAFVVLERASDDLNAREAYWILKLNTLTTGHGYNINLPLPGGSYIMPEATKIKIGDALRDVPKSAAHKAKISSFLRGRKQPAHTIAKRVAKITGTKRTAEQKANTSKARMRAMPWSLIHLPSGEIFNDYNLEQFCRVRKLHAGRGMGSM